MIIYKIFIFPYLLVGFNFHTIFMSAPIISEEKISTMYKNRQIISCHVKCGWQANKKKLVFSCKTSAHAHMKYISKVYLCYIFLHVLERGSWNDIFKVFEYMELAIDVLKCIDIENFKQLTLVFMYIKLYFHWTIYTVQFWNSSCAFWKKKQVINSSFTWLTLVCSREYDITFIYNVHCFQGKL